MKRPSRTRKCFRGPGRSACRSIVDWKRTLKSWNSSASSSRKSSCMGIFASNRASERRSPMNKRFLISMGGLVSAMALLAPVTVSGQTTSPTATTAASTLARTPDGKPDLQGVWDFRTITPLERPRELGTKAFFTEAEAAAWEKDENRRLNRDLIDPEVGGLMYPPGGVVPYNEFWYDRGDKVVGTRRTSLIVDPPDGRLPALTPDGKVKAEARALAGRETQLGRPKADSWEDRPLQERCIMGLNAGPPMTPGAYNNNVQLSQTPEYVVILTEMVHDARIVPMDGRPFLNIPQWKGESRGRWEGDTLVVETKNFKRETSLPGSSASTHLIERFTRSDANTLLYEFTVNDPSTWTRPWTAVVPMVRSEDPIYEYACHEANYALPGILGGARADEKAAEEAAKKGSK